MIAPLVFIFASWENTLPNVFLKVQNQKRRKRSPQTYQATNSANAALISAIVVVVVPNWRITKLAARLPKRVASQAEPPF
jgi:hypothetical protein